MAYANSLKDLNKLIQRDIHASVVLHKGEGYHYFEFDDGIKFETESVMVPFTNRMTIAQWMDGARAFAEKHDPKVVDELQRVEGPALPAHVDVIGKLLARILAADNSHYRRAGEPDKHQIKEYVVQHFPGSFKTYLWVVTGLKGDEGTMASVFARKTRHIAIGKRGGLVLLNSKNKRESEGWWNAVHQLTN